MFSPTLIDYCAWCNSKDRRLLTARRIPDRGRAMICDECWDRDWERKTIEGPFK